MYACDHQRRGRQGKEMWAPSSVADVPSQGAAGGKGEGITKSSPCQPLGQQRARVCWLLEGFLQQAQEGSKFVRSSKWHLRGENGGWDFPGSAKPLSRSLSLAWLVILFYLQRESILPFHPSKSSEFQYRSLSF